MNRQCPMMSTFVSLKGTEAIRKVAWHHDRPGRSVVIATPPAGQDFNDVLRAASGG